MIWHFEDEELNWGGRTSKETPILVANRCMSTPTRKNDAGVPSPDGNTRICWTLVGAYGRTFNEITRKYVEVSIKRGHLQEKQILFLNKYKFIGGEVVAEAQWKSLEEVVFRVRDSLTTAEPCVLTLTFALDKKTGKYAEKS